MNLTENYIHCTPTERPDLGCLQYAVTVLNGWLNQKYLQKSPSFFGGADQPAQMTYLTFYPDANRLQLLRVT
jgi:hypothetical protein